MMKPAGLLVGTSPGRERLPRPPGLAGRFLGGRWRSGGSSSRTGPMFVSRNRSVGRSSAAKTALRVTEGGEPSSPKVTCIGQVRIRGKKSGSVSSSTTSTPAGASKLKRSASSKRSERREEWLMPCRCLHFAWICGFFRPRRKKAKEEGGCAGGTFRWSRWRRWASFGVRNSRHGEDRGARTGGCWKRRSEPQRLPPRPELVILKGRELNVDEHREEERVSKEEEESEPEASETTVFVPSGTATPPKNALLLMRCRSAPHNRASALSTLRFAVSPPSASGSPTAEPPKDEDGTDKAEEEGEKEDAGTKSSNVRLSVEVETTAKATTDATEEPAAAADEEEDEEEEEEEEDEMRSESQRPLALTRSKSEPASSSASAPEDASAASYCFWNGSGRKRSLGPLQE